MCDLITFDGKSETGVRGNWFISNLDSLPGILAVASKVEELAFFELVILYFPASDFNLGF